MKKETRFVLWLLLIILLGGVTFLIIGMAGLPSLKALEEYQPKLSSKVYYADGSLMSEFGEEHRTLISLNQMPENLRNATGAIEDERFLKHKGVDFYRILGAAVQDILHMKLKEGASTITQQLARSLFLTRKKTFIRKFREAMLSLEIERRYTKEQILEMYLNQIYYGSGAYGVGSAAWTFFGKETQNLNTAECALLAGLPRSPSNYYSPYQNPENTFARQKLVLKKMRELGYITPEEEYDARKTNIVIRPPMHKEIKPLYFIEYLRIYLEEKYGSELLYRGGLEIYTTADPVMQKTAEKVFPANIQRLRKELKKENIDGALVSIDPATGEVKAMIGGCDFKKSQFNRAVQAHRQPGSAFKPFIYLAALDMGFKPDDTVLDSGVSYPASEKNKKWEPKNYDGIMHGTVTLRVAIAQSLNLATIKLIELVGPENVIPYAAAAGIKSPLGADLSLALGTYEVTPLELTQAFSTIANRGVRTEPFFIRLVKDSEGRILEETSPRFETALNASTCEQVTELMRGVVEFGTARYLSAYGFRYKCAGKTGTTDEFTDAWFVGFTPTIVTTVYVGRDDKTTLGPRMSGAAVALPIWAEYMNGAYRPSTQPETKPAE